MTRAELTAHHDLQRRLNEARAIYRTLRLEAHPKAQTIDGMPRPSEPGRKVENLGLVLADFAGQVEELERQVEQSRPAVLEWLTTIEEPTPRAIMSLRVLCGLPWKRVAEYSKTTVEAARWHYRKITAKLR